jgi:hypothetical protein
MAKVEPWIAALKVGDSVIVESGQWSPSWAMCKVSRVFPSGRVEVNGQLFNPDGSRRGGDRLGCRLKEATPERLKCLEHAARVSRLRFSVNWPLVSPSKVQEICAILDRPDPPEQEAP